MTLQTLRIARLTLGSTAAVAMSYGYGWTLSFVAPICTFMFLAMPAWIGGKMARQLMFRLGCSLLMGVAISEYLLDFPLLCVPVYGLLLFYIYYNDTPSAPPMATMFMTLGVTMVPLMSFSGLGLAHMIAFFLLFNMGCGLLFAWLFHTLLPDSFCRENVGDRQVKKPPPSPPPPDHERARLALVSTIVALSAVLLFFALNLVQHALAMIYICFMAGTPRTNASVKVMKANATACCIGGVAIIIAFNLLVAVPTYPFLCALILCFALFFSIKIYGGGVNSAAFASGFSTFLVLLGSSTGVDKSAAANFYLRISQVLFAGIFTLVALVVVEHFLRPRRWTIKKAVSKVREMGQAP
jgi:hypothetical protein